MMKKLEISKYERAEKKRSLYYYDDTEVYVNHFNIKDGEKLKQIEADITNQRLYELMKEPIRGNFGLRYLNHIHTYIFQDIYPFAGKLRKENIIKDETFFCKTEYIEINLNRLFDDLKAEQYLEHIDKSQLIKRLAYYMSELNIIHPFREGNGRAIREYIRCLALHAGYYINWSVVNHQQLLNAMIASVNNELMLLEECLEMVLEDL